MCSIWFDALFGYIQSNLGFVTQLYTRNTYTDTCQMHKIFFMIFQRNMCSKKSKPFNNVDQMWIYPPYAKNRFSLWRNLRILSIFFNGIVLHKQNLPILAIKGKLIGKFRERWPSRIFCKPNTKLRVLLSNGVEKNPKKSIHVFENCVHMKNVNYCRMTHISKSPEFS